jgi:hypothetical protein
MMRIMNEILRFFSVFFCHRKDKNLHKNGKGETIKKYTGFFLIKMKLYRFFCGGLKAGNSTLVGLYLTTKAARCF